MANTLSISKPTGLANAKVKSTPIQRLNCNQHCICVEGEAYDTADKSPRILLARIYRMGDAVDDPLPHGKNVMSYVPANEGDKQYRFQFVPEAAPNSVNLTVAVYAIWRNGDPQITTKSFINTDAGTTGMTDCEGGGSSGSGSGISGMPPRNLITDFELAARTYYVRIEDNTGKFPADQPAISSSVRLSFSHLHGASGQATWVGKGEKGEAWELNIRKHHSEELYVAHLVVHAQTDPTKALYCWVTGRWDFFKANRMIEEISQKQTTTIPSVVVQMS